MVGGLLHYMEKGLNAKWLVVVFAVATVLSSFGTGNLPQISIASGLRARLISIPSLRQACFQSLLALVIIGGITRIAKVAAAIVPQWQ